MKKIITLITILFITLITTTTVYAANYEIKELIPVGTKTTIVTKYFSYRQFYYEKTDNKIHFQSIKNISDTEMPVSISIGLFGKNKKNIGGFLSDDYWSSDQEYYDTYNGWNHYYLKYIDFYDGKTWKVLDEKDSGSINVRCIRSVY